MKHPFPALLVAALLLPIVTLPAGTANADPAVTAAADTHPNKWQVRRLMEPTSAELARELAGEIVIYDSLTDQEVEAAWRLLAYPCLDALALPACGTSASAAGSPVPWGKPACRGHRRASAVPELHGVIQAAGRSSIRNCSPSLISAAATAMPRTRISASGMFGW